MSPERRSRASSRRQSERTTAPSAAGRRPPQKSIDIPPFDAHAFLDSAGVARHVLKFHRGEVIYSQGDPANAVLYMQDGGVKLSVVSSVGKEAVVGMMGPGDFFGEGCLAGQAVRTGTATAMTPSTVLAIDKKQRVGFRLLLSPGLSVARRPVHQFSRRIRWVSAKQ